MNMHYIPSIKLLATTVPYLTIHFSPKEWDKLSIPIAKQVFFFSPEVRWFYGYFLPSEVLNHFI